PSESRRAARLEVAGRLRTTPEEALRLRASIAQLRLRHGVITAARVAELPGVNTEALHFAALGDFFDGLARGARDRAAEPASSGSELDFHQALTAVARYPLLMRKLGVVVDLMATVDAAALSALPPQGRVRVLVAAPGVSGWDSFSPWTTYAL